MIRVSSQTVVNYGPAETGIFKRWHHPLIYNLTFSLCLFTWILTISTSYNGLELQFLSNFMLALSRTFARFIMLVKNHQWNSIGLWILVNPKKLENHKSVLEKTNNFNKSFFSISWDIFAVENLTKSWKTEKLCKYLGNWKIMKFFIRKDLIF